LQCIDRISKINRNSIDINQKMAKTIGQMVTVHQSQFGWDQYVLNAEKMPLGASLLANPTASGEVSTLGAIRMNREQARSYRCNRVPVNGYKKRN